MRLIIDLSHPARDRCPLCRCLMEKLGYPVTDDQGVRAFCCERHLAELLAAPLRPLKTITAEE